MYEVFTKRLKELRLENDYFQKDVALGVGVKLHSITDWELGRSEPDLEMLAKLAKFYQVTTDYLLGLTDEY